MFPSHSSLPPSFSSSLPVRWYASVLVLLLLLAASLLGLLEVAQSGSFRGLSRRAAQLQNLETTLSSDLRALPDQNAAPLDPAREIAVLVRLCENYRHETAGLGELGEGPLSGGLRRAEEQITAACLVPDRLNRSSGALEEHSRGVREFRVSAGYALAALQSALIDHSRLVIQMHARQQETRLAELTALSLLTLGCLGYLLWWRTQHRRKQAEPHVVGAAAATPSSSSIPPQWMRTALESAPDGILMVERGGQIRAANPAAEELLGWQRGELIGKAAGKVIPAFDPRADSPPRGSWPHTVALSREGVERLHPLTWAHRPDLFSILYLRRESAVASPPPAAMPAPGDIDRESLEQLENQILLVTGYSEVALSNLPPGDLMRADIEELARAGARSALLCREAMTILPAASAIAWQPVDLNAFLRNFELRLRALTGAGAEIIRRVDAIAGSVESDPGLLEQALLSLTLGALPSARDPLLIRLSCSLGRIELAVHTRGAVNLGWSPDPVIKPRPAGQWLELLGASVEQETASRGGRRFRIHLDGRGAARRAANTPAAATDADAHAQTV